MLRSGQLSGDNVCRPWITNLLRICDSHRLKFNKDGYLPRVGVKVVLAVCGYQPEQAELPEPQQKDRWLYVDITQVLSIPTGTKYHQITKGAVMGRVATEQQKKQVKILNDQTEAKRTSGSYVGRKKQLADMIKAYKESIKKNPSKKIREKSLVRLSLDEASEPLSQLLELPPQNALQTPNNRQYLTPVSVDEVGESSEVSRKTTTPTSLQKATSSPTILGQGCRIG